MSDVNLREEWDKAYLSDGNMSYVDSLYEDYLLDKQSVPEDWRLVFQQIQQDNTNVKDVCKLFQINKCRLRI